VFAETVIAALLGASITGAGLILAVYALITPLFEKLFKDRIARLQIATKEYETKRSEWKKLKDPNQKLVGAFILAGLDEEIGITKNFPKYLRYGVSLTFILFVFSVGLDATWLMGIQHLIIEVALSLTFWVGLLSFGYVGVLTILEISHLMIKDFEVMKKQQEEAKKLEKETN
jgi:hypothetical protein